MVVLRPMGAAGRGRCGGHLAHAALAQARCVAAPRVAAADISGGSHLMDDQQGGHAPSATRTAGLPLRSQRRTIVRPVAVPADDTRPLLRRLLPGHADTTGFPKPRTLYRQQWADPQGRHRDEPYLRGGRLPLLPDLLRPRQQGFCLDGVLRPLGHTGELLRLCAAGVVDGVAAGQPPRDIHAVVAIAGTAPRDCLHAPGNGRTDGAGTQCTDDFSRACSGIGGDARGLQWSRGTVQHVGTRLPTETLRARHL